jgi:hypothetical protein
LGTAPRIANICGRVMVFAIQITFLVVFHSQYTRTLGY